MKKGEGVYTTDKWRYRNKAAVLLSTMLLTAALLTGCGASSSTGKGAEQTPSAAPQVNYATDDIYMQEAETTAEESTGTVMGQPETDVPAGANRKLIKTVDMNVETEAYDVLFPKVQTRVGELGGYIENLSEQQENYGYKTNLRYVSITARIPEDKLESFMTEVAAASNVISRNERVEDVTLSYVDLESRKKTLVTERDRLLVLLEQAETVEDIITIEGRLSQVSYEIESMESQLRTYDNRINYSTVYLYIREVERLTPPVETTTLERIKTGLRENTYNVTTGMKNFGIGLIISLPYIIVWAAVLLIFFIIIRIVIKAQKKRALKNGLQRQRTLPPFAITPPAQPNHQTTTTESEQPHEQ